jgi:hypothetical protein
MEEDLNMGLFGNNIELNLDYAPEYNEDEPENDEIPDGVLNTPEGNNINDQIEDEAPEEVDEVDEPEEGNEEGSESSSNLYSSLATVVYEQGLIPSWDIEKNKIENIEDFVTVFKQEQEIQAQLKLEEYLANIDVNQIAQSKKEIQDLSKISVESLQDNLELAKQIIQRDYQNQGLDEAKTNRMLKRLIDLGDDAILEDAQESLESLKQFENKKIEAEKASYKERIEADKLAQIELENQLKKSIYESKDLINGFKPNKAIQDKVYKSITEIVGKSPDGTFENKFMKERREDPVAFETRMYHFYELTNGFKDFSKIATSAKSNAVKDLEAIARKSAIQDNGTPLWTQDSNSYDNVRGHVLNL